MKTKDFSELLAYIDDNIADKKPSMTIYAKSYLFIDETSDKIEGLKIDIIGNSVRVCLYAGYDRVATKYGFKYETIRDFYNNSYILSFNQKDKLLARLEYYSNKGID